MDNLWIYLLVTLLASLVLVVVISEYLGRRRVKKYEDQGFKSYIVPFIGGEIDLFIKSSKEQSRLESLTKLVKQAITENKPAIVFNGQFGKTAMIYPLDIQLLKEFFLKEIQVVRKVPMGDHKVNLGFGFTDSESALKKKAIFSDFFKVDHVELFIEPFLAIIDEKFSKLKVSSGKLALGSSSELMKEIMFEFVQNMIFNNEERTFLDTGKHFSEEIVAIVDILYSDKVFYNAYNNLFQDLPNQLNLLAGSREVSDRAAAMTKKLKEYIGQRSKVVKAQSVPMSARKVSLIDVQLEHNATAPEADKIPLDTLVGNLIGLFLAAFDTTKTSVLGFLYCMAQKPDLQEKLREEIKSLGLDKGKLNFERIEQAQLLEKVAKEVIRIYTPAPTTMERVIEKDFTIGGFKFFRGDRMRIPIASLMWNDLFFKSGTEFDIESIDASNKRYYMPFSAGRRNCIGQIFAQLELKLIAVYVLSRYRLEVKPATEALQYKMCFTMQLTNCDVEFSPL